MTRRDEGYKPKPVKNDHSTVKPVALMRYLCKLVTPAGGIVGDFFMGSGTTGVAAIMEGFGFIGIDDDAEDSFTIAQTRINYAAANNAHQATILI